MCSLWCQHHSVRDTTVLVATAVTWSDHQVRTAILLARAQLRRGWRNLVGLSLLVGLVGGLVLGGLAGAQRTRTAVDRMIVSQQSFDVSINPESGDQSALDFDEVAALPMVRDFSRVHGVLSFPVEITADNIFSAPFILATDGALGIDFDRPILTAGHMPDPSSLDEVYLDRTYAEREGLHVGDTVRFRIVSRDVLDVAFAALEIGDMAATLTAVNAADAGRNLDLKVGGIGNGLVGIVVDEGYEPPAILMGPALYESLGEPTAGFGGAVVRLVDPERVNEFKAAVNALVPDDDLIVYQTQAVSRAKALRATEPAATALAIFALITTLLGTLLIGQAVSRRFQLDARDNSTLAALGVTERQRFVTSMIRLTLAVAVGVAVAVGFAAALSLLTPVGPAEHAEPDPGFQFATSILLGGALILFALFVAAGTIPAWNNARQRERSGALRGSTVAGWLSARGAPPQLTTGVRFGLEPGRGATAVPTRATIIGAITAITVAVATIVFAASLDNVVHDGRFYGSNFDVSIDFASELSSDANMVDGVVSAVAADPATAQVSEMRITEIVVDGVAVTSLAFGSSTQASPIEPTIAAGHAPATAGEIALGLTTMRQLKVALGDTVDLVVDGTASTAEVVGRAVLPGVGLYEGSDRTSIGVGAIVSPAALGPRTDATKGFVVASLDEGADLADFERRAGDALAAFGEPQFQTQGRPSDIVGLARLKSLPVVLSSLLVVVVGVTVANAMVVAVRRRRRDIAILQALGSTRGAVTAIGAWQGLTIGVAALLFGVPLGLVVGRWFWTILANSFGTLAEPIIPAVGIGALVAVVLALAAFAGVVPVWRGLRHRPADVLRGE